jgi:hypothetical protein
MLLCSDAQINADIKSKNRRERQLMKRLNKENWALKKEIVCLPKLH